MRKQTLSLIFARYFGMTNQTFPIDDDIHIQSTSDGGQIRTVINEAGYFVLMHNDSFSSKRTNSTL